MLNSHRTVDRNFVPTLENLVEVINIWAMTDPSDKWFSMEGRGGGKKTIIVFWC